MNRIMKTVAIAPSAKAIGMPANIANKGSGAVEQPNGGGRHCCRLAGRSSPAICSKSCTLKSVMPADMSE